ncbi:hypothetical protein SESBI_09754 [Sesbania bispinosa]|nr:hypothetical protein SESBI_09754 [Sesbania bispinosa]
MGSAQSAKGRRLFPLLPSSSDRYHRLSDSSALLPHQNPCVEIEHDEVQAYREKSYALEKEIHELKSNIPRLQTMMQTSISKLQSSEAKAGITSLKEKVDKLKRSLDEEIVGREADKRAFTNQGLAINRLEDKNIDVENEITELKTRVNEITSTMLELAAVGAEFKHESLRSKEAFESDEVRTTDLWMMTVPIPKEGLLYIILIFLIGVLIGLNL